MRRPDVLTLALVPSLLFVDPSLIVKSTSLAVYVSPDSGTGEVGAALGTTVTVVVVDVVVVTVAVLAIGALIKFSILPGELPCPIGSIASCSGSSLDSETSSTSNSLSDVYRLEEELLDIDKSILAFCGVKRNVDGLSP